MASNIPVEISEPLLSALREDVICTTCLCVPSVGMFQCENGHLICKTCIGKCSNQCPTCKKPLGKIRSIIAEKVKKICKISWKPFTWDLQIKSRKFTILTTSCGMLANIFFVFCIATSWSNIFCIRRFCVNRNTRHNLQFAPGDQWWISTSVINLVVASARLSKLS